MAPGASGGLPHGGACLGGLGPEGGIFQGHVLHQSGLEFAEKARSDVRSRLGSNLKNRPKGTRLKSWPFPAILLMFQSVLELWSSVWIPSWCPRRPWDPFNMIE